VIALFIIGTTLTVVPTRDVPEPPETQLVMSMDRYEGPLARGLDSRRNPSLRLTPASTRPVGSPVPTRRGLARTPIVTSTAPRRGTTLP
jgi:hypothetical protein